MTTTTTIGTPVVTKEIKLTHPTLKDVREAWEKLQNLMGRRVIGPYFPPQKIHIEFDERVEVRVNQRNVKELKVIDVKFFDSKQGNFCYTLHRQTGYPVSHYLPYGHIASMSIKSKEPESAKEERVQQILNRRHPNAWQHLSKEDRSLKWLELKTVSITNKFPTYVIENLRSAFDNREEYHYSQPGTKRDLSVSTRVTKDGFCAWFSSEYHGCANGSYYLLLNPTTAAFREDD